MGNCFCWTKFFRKIKSNKGYREVKLCSGNVHLITRMDSWETKLTEACRDEKIVVANFSTKWCKACKTIAPIYSEIADKYPSILFLTVDADELKELSTKWDIKATPTFFFFKGGRSVDKLKGANKEHLQKKTAALMYDLATKSYY